MKLQEHFCTPKYYKNNFVCLYLLSRVRSGCAFIMGSTGLVRSSLSPCHPNGKHDRMNISRVNCPFKCLRTCCWLYCKPSFIMKPSAGWRVSDQTHKWHVKQGRVWDVKQGKADGDYTHYTDCGKHLWNRIWEELLLVYSQTIQALYCGQRCRYQLLRKRAWKISSYFLISVNDEYYYFFEQEKTLYILYQDSSTELWEEKKLFV